MREPLIGYPIGGIQKSSFTIRDNLLYFVTLLESLISKVKSANWTIHLKEKCNMNAFKGKAPENGSQESHDHVFQRQATGESVAPFVDQRPEAVAQRKRQEAANNSPQNLQLKAIQAKANPGAGQAAPIQRKTKRGGEGHDQHATVREGDPGQMIINYVWIGDGELGELEKFNIYSWLALGHKVNIFFYHFKLETPNDISGLGLDVNGKNLELINMREVLDKDSVHDMEEEERDTDFRNHAPEKLMTDTRNLMKDWFTVSPEEVPKASKRDHIYNLVDLTKSYIGATRRGIVLDMKVGPSPHLQDYAPAFQEKFVSATRGGNTFGPPENFMMGTMQEGQDLRQKYAHRFNRNASQLDKDTDSLLKEKKVGKHFNSITSYHGRATLGTKNWLNVAEEAPDGTKIDRKGRLNDDYAVEEPGAIGHGPFRVFKDPSDQTNKSNSIKTDPAYVKELAGKSLKEMPAIEEGETENGNYRMLQEAQNQYAKKWKHELANE